jgi:PEP-CTERM motif
MRLCSVTVIGAALALILMPARARADLFLTMGSASASLLERDPVSMSVESANHNIRLWDIVPEMTSPFFSPLGGGPQTDVGRFDTSDSNYDFIADFIAPQFSYGADEWRDLYRMQGFTDPVPEPSLALLMTGGLFAIAWRSRQISKAARR